MRLSSRALRGLKSALENAEERPFSVVQPERDVLVRGRGRAGRGTGDNRGDHRRLQCRCGEGLSSEVLEEGGDLDRLWRRSRDRRC